MNDLSSCAFEPFAARALLSSAPSPIWNTNIIFLQTCIFHFVFLQICILHCRQNVFDQIWSKNVIILQTSFSKCFLLESLKVKQTSFLCFIWSMEGSFESTGMYGFLRRNKLIRKMRRSNSNLSERLDDPCCYHLYHWLVYIVKYFG